MDSDILLSKLVANPTENTWAQIYSTLNLYVVLSIKRSASSTTEGSEINGNTQTTSAISDESKDQRTISAAGKDLLERIQREYFSLDTKSLENIKKSIGDATSDIADLKNISIVLANITGDILYLIVVSGGRVILRRNGKVATIAAGTPGEVGAFSGKIQPDDTIVLETDGFAQKIPVEKLSESLDNLDVSQISENLAPLIHADPAGNEAAIILQYKKHGSEPQVAPIDPTEKAEENNEVAPPAQENIPQTREEIHDDLAWEKDAIKDVTNEADDPITHLADDTPSHSNGRKITLPKFLSGDKKIIIIVVIIILGALLAGSIFFEKNRKETTTQNQTLQELLGPAQQKFDEATALVSLNKGLALDEFNDIKASLATSQSKLPTGSEARKKLDEFIAKVDQKINELSSGATLTNQKKIFDKSSYVAYRGDKLYSVDSSGKVSILSESGTSEDEIETKNKNPRAIGANDDNVFVAGDEGITSGDGVEAEDAGTIVALDTFGANLYALNTTDKTVDKYPTANFTKSTYFTEDVTLASPTSLTIDASIWIVDGDKIRKFTKGKEDEFSVSGLTKAISKGSLITTGVDYENIYVLNPANKRIVAISKSGELKEQYTSKDLAQATSIAVDEPNKKVYVVISGKLNSFDL